MKELKIKCPYCQTRLKLPISGNETEKNYICPKCNKGIKVKIKQPATPPPSKPIDKTMLPGDIGKEDKTQLPEKRSTPGCLVCNGKTYPLKEGINTVGRKSESRPATIMLEVDDRYMSREHVMVTVAKKGNGFDVAIKNHRNMNETYVGDSLLKDGEEVLLSDGSTIKMGNTVVTYRTLSIS